MSDQTAIVTSNSMTIQEAVERYNLVVQFTKTVMKVNKDFGIIPGTDKPTLLKPGAEKLCSLFRLTPRFNVKDKIVDFPGGFFYFQYECELTYDGKLIATGLGSCNSKEKKYRYRNVTEKKASDEDKARAIRVESKSGSYGNYKVYVIENTEPFDIVNTIDKMAQKRSLIAATLIAANASEFFTQDVEDIDIIEGDYHEAPNPPPPAQSKGNGKPKAEPMNPDRPYSPEMLVQKLNRKATEYSGREASEKQHGLFAGMIDLLVMGDEDKRKTILLQLFGVASRKDVLPEQVLAALDWLKPAKDSGGAFAPDPMATKEAEAVWTASLKEEGQQELI